MNADIIACGRTIDKVESTMADIEDQRQLADEIARAIATPSGADALDEVRIVSIPVAAAALRRFDARWMNDSLLTNVLPLLLLMYRTRLRTSWSNCNRRNWMLSLWVLLMFQRMSLQVQAVCNPVCPFFHWFDYQFNLTRACFCSCTSDNGGG
jgi:hypothetical protein